MISNKEMIDCIKEGKQKKIKLYPQHVVRASEIGHPCTRYLVYSITNWQDRVPHSSEVQFIFEGGRAIEELAHNDLVDAGFKVYEPEPDNTIMESRPRITGHLDRRVAIDGTVYTVEIKGLNYWDWSQLNTIEDFHRSKKPWIKKYPGQLMTYLYIKNEMVGAFYLKSIPRFQPKWIWVELDLEYMESLLQKTEAVEKHVANKTLPDPINDLTTCEYCAFKHICLPLVLRDELRIIDNAELEELLEQWHELKPYVTEYNQIDKKLKEMINEQDRLVVGDYLITGQWIEKKAFTVKESRYWKSKIMPLKKGEDGDA